MADLVEPDRETLRRADWLTYVENEQSEYVYAWERIQGVSGNSHVMRAKAAGYEIVRGESPENADVRDATGFCSISDVVLLRIKKDRLKKLQDEIRAEIAMKRGTGNRDSLNDQLSEEISRKLGKPVNVTFSYTDPKDLSNRR